jgi:hypothetical protein
MLTPGPVAVGGVADLAAGGLLGVLAVVDAARATGVRPPYLQPAPAPARRAPAAGASGSIDPRSGLVTGSEDATRLRLDAVSGCFYFALRS